MTHPDSTHLDNTPPWRLNRRAIFQKGVLLCTAMLYSFSPSFPSLSGVSRPWLRILPFPHQWVRKQMRLVLQRSQNKPRVKPRPIQQKIQKPKKVKKTTPKKPREISLYSPEYLAKKHGIKINDTQPEKKISKQEKRKVSFGFYNSLIVFIFLVISFSRILYFSQEFFISNIPASEYYLNYFFESIRNIFEIWKNLITVY